MNNYTTFIGYIERMMLLLVAGSVLGCASRPPAVARTADHETRTTTQATLSPGAFVYRPPTTTPYDNDPIRRGQYLKAYHAGWNSGASGNHATCCEATKAVTEGYYAGQTAADELITGYLLNGDPSKIEERIRLIEERTRFMKEQLQAQPVKDWYIPDYASQK